MVKTINQLFCGVHLAVLGEAIALGKRAGVVLNPHTPEESVRYVLGDVDLILVMSVNPGFGGPFWVRQKLGSIHQKQRLAVDSDVAFILEDAEQVADVFPIILQ